MFPIEDELLNNLEWEDVDGERVDNLFTGCEVLGAEPTNYPETDAITLYLKDPEGRVTALEMGAYIFTLEPLDNPFYIKKAIIRGLKA